MTMGRCSCVLLTSSLKYPSANRTYTEEELEAMDGRLIDVEPVAQMVLDAIRRNELYIHTHKEAQVYFERRMKRISDAFSSAI